MALSTNSCVSNWADWVSGLHVCARAHTLFSAPVSQSGRYLLGSAHVDEMTSMLHKATQKQLNQVCCRVHVLNVHAHVQFLTPISSCSPAMPTVTSVRRRDPNEGVYDELRGSGVIRPTVSDDVCTSTLAARRRRSRHEREHLSTANTSHEDGYNPLACSCGYPQREPVDRHRPIITGEACGSYGERVCVRAH